jgi:signal transduction histidine kinase
MSSSPATPEWDASRLAEAALVGEPRDSISLLLKKVAEMCSSLGCVLWRASADADPAENPPRGRMSLLAAWFDTKISSQLLAIHGLRFEDGSVAGKALRVGKPVLSNDFLADKDPNAQHPFFAHHNVTRTLAAPITYASGRLGAVNIYRRETAPSFEQADAATLAKIGKLLPHLYRAARQRAAFELLREIGEIVRGSSPRTRNAKETRLAQDQALKQLCGAVQKMFQAVEVSVFLEMEDRLGIFRCAFTTEGPHAEATRQLEYKPSYKHGFSGLSLRTGACVRIYDTQECDEQVSELRENYPKFAGHKSRGFSGDVNKWLQVPDGWKPPPHSLMVVPLISGQKQHGFLRCWIAQKGPPFFSADDLDLLQLVAEQFTHALETWREELGVCDVLSRAQVDAASAKENAIRYQKEHRVTLEDIHHQMKGPLAEAKRRVDDLLEDGRRAMSGRDLYAIRSMLDRASLMSKKIGMLTKLDNGEPLSLPTGEIKPLEIVRLVGEICENNQFRIFDKKNIRIEFNSESILKSAPVDLSGNLDLLAEAVHNVVDNAVKYSYANTKIRVYGGLGRTERFYLAVANVGVPIHPHEISQCRQRHWRGAAAARSTGEGNGIGLWIVDHIMKTLGGELQIIPTRSNDGVTEVRLAFAMN